MDAWDVSSWEAFVASHPCGHLLQTVRWGALKSQFGWESHLVALGEGGAIVAGAQVLYRWLPPARLVRRLSPWTGLGYVPKGPLVDWSEPDQVRTVLGRLVADARQRRVVLLRIEPNLEIGQLPGLDGLLAEAGFSPADGCFQPRRTLLIDLDGSEQDVLARMKQKTRYNIRLAARKQVVVRQGGAADVAIFARLMQVTGERNIFGVHNEAYLRAAYDHFAPSGDVALLVAEYNHRPLAALMVFALGPVAWYLYGASGNEERQRMPSHLLQWEAMRWARARGCTSYDLWGVPDEDEARLETQFEERSDGLWGVYRFKRGFGGRLVRWVGAYDRVYSRPLYALFRRMRA